MKSPTVTARSRIHRTKPTAIGIVSTLLHVGHKPTIGDLARVQQAWDDAIRDTATVTRGTATEGERLEVAVQAARREALAILAGR